MDGLTAACMDHSLRRSRDGDDSCPPLRATSALRHARHNAATKCRRWELPVMRPANGALERRHTDRGPGARHTDIQMPPDLELAFRDELTVNQRIHFFEGRTMVHLVLSSQGPSRRRAIRPESSRECFTGGLESGRTRGGRRGYIRGRAVDVYLGNEVVRAITRMRQRPECVGPLPHRVRRGLQDIRWRRPLGRPAVTARRSVGDGNSLS